MTPKRLMEIAIIIADRLRPIRGFDDHEGIQAMKDLRDHAVELRRIQVLFDTTKFVQVPVNPARVEEEKQDG